ADEGWWRWRRGAAIQADASAGIDPDGARTNRIASRRTHERSSALKMSTITDIHNPWRDALKPASFRGAYFHVEAGSKDNGRRIVMHEDPKKEICYAEDMGRRAKSFTVRAYCIQFPVDVG